MLHKIPIPIPTPEGIMFIPKVATSLVIPYSTWAYCKELDPDPEDEEGNEFGWWCFTSDETPSQDEVEAVAGTAPTQAEGEQL